MNVVYTVEDAWCDYCVVAIYSNEEAAKEHVRLNKERLYLVPRTVQTEFVMDSYLGQAIQWGKDAQRLLSSIVTQGRLFYESFNGQRHS